MTGELGGFDFVYDCGSISTKFLHRAVQTYRVVAASTLGAMPRLHSNPYTRQGASIELAHGNLGVGCRSTT